MNDQSTSFLLAEFIVPAIMQIPGTVAAPSVSPNACSRPPSLILAKSGLRIAALPSRPGAAALLDSALGSSDAEQAAERVRLLLSGGRRTS